MIMSGECGKFSDKLLNCFKKCFPFVSVECGKTQYMIIREFYEAIDSDYREVLNRLCKDERIEKYLLKFVSANNMDDFEKAYEAKDYKEAFRVVHSMKGMSLNLGLSKLCEQSSEVCEELREGSPKEDISRKIEKLRETYTYTIDNIKLISKSA